MTPTTPRRTVARALLAALAVGTAACTAAAQAPPAPPPPAVAALGPPGLPAERFPRPARPVASIISDRWSDEGSRERAGEAARVMDLTGVRPGTAVADIGAGSGYYAVRLARRVGPAGRVFAQDIREDYLANLARRLARERLANVTPALGEPHDPRLPPASVDVALLVHMYHEIEQPYGLLANLIPALRGPGARVGIVDLDGPTERHGTPPALLRCELAAVGYREVAWHWIEGRSVYLAVFAPPERAPEPGRIAACGAGR